jgi:hypothetical protein
MKIRIITQLFILTAVLMQATIGFAFETDQYNLPPRPLADIGIEVNEYVESIVMKSVEKVNSEILQRESCLVNRGKDCDSAEKTLKRLAYLRSDDAVAREVYKVLGGGIVPYTNSGTWIEKHEFRGQPARYKTSFGDSLFVRFPTSYFELASTVKMFGSQFGTDKIAHIFQQGYDYFEDYNKALAKGTSPKQALEKAIKSGQKSESGIYGTLISGVYSNGDLAANYAGFKFYQGFTTELTVNGESRPALLKLKEGIWTINEAFVMKSMLLKPFVSNHLNEALNPSGFTRLFGLNSSVKKLVKNRACAEWINQFPTLQKEDFLRTTDSLKRWNNEDYGFTEKKNFVTIGNTCFEAAN